MGAHGQAAIEPDPIPLRMETPFDLASLTKPLATALIATILEREGRLSLDAPLASTFPELSASPFGRASLRDAAAHQAGFVAWAPLYLAGTTREAYLAAIAASPRDGAPGDTLYSDLGYVLLGFAVERAGGAPIDRLFEDRIARPLGLTRCGFAGTTGTFADAAATERHRSFEQGLAGPHARCDHVLTDVRRGQVHDGNAWGLGGVAGHAGLFGTATDLAAIAAALLDPRRIGLESRDLDAMFHPVSPRAGSRTIGFLRAKDSDSVRGVLPDDAVGHWGFTGTSLWIDAARPRVYVLLTNRIHPRVPQEPFTATRRAFHVSASALP
jgi:CubicO group peptidase (beta-lactamase class C family)